MNKRLEFSIIYNMKPYLIFFLSWLFPGSGHLIQKKYLKGAVFITGILLLLVMGIVMEGRFYDTKHIHPLLILGFLGDLGNGILFFLIKILNFDAGNIKAVTYNYGTTFMVTAGLLNYLIALNAFDIARGKK